jgi:transcriptional regulator with XRE-family HTH domain
MTEARTRPIATIEQIRAARALLGWSQGELAHHAGLSQTGIARIENGTNRPNTNTLDKILRAFDREDVELIGTSGVKKRTGEIRTLQGRGGFADFMDDVYETVKANGQDAEVCVSNVDEKQFDKWFKETGSTYLDKMQNLRKNLDFKFRIIICEGDNFQIASYAEYKTAKPDHFGAVPFYVYGNKLALILFEEKDIAIYIIENKKIADAQRKEFNLSWGSAQSVQ